ncbi:MAG: EamA family transporter [Proteobacteria bacterium]|nr:EamA family transporter [Pseudomonadota bacterium]
MPIAAIECVSARAAEQLPETDRRYRVVGTLLVAGGAMLFAVKGLFAKWLYGKGVSFEAVVTVRALLAMPAFWLFGLRGAGTARKLLHAPRPAIGAAIVAGFLCYYVGAMVDFYALTLIDASIERILLFSYPAMVVLISSVRERQWPSRKVVTAVTITYVGIFLAVGGLEQDVFSANLLGAGLVLISALSYAIYFLIGARYTHDLGSSRFTLVAMTTAGIALAAHFSLFGTPNELWQYDTPVWLTLIVMSIVCMFFPALMQAEGVKRVGAQRGSVASTVGPPTTILLAAVLLDERLTATQLIGTALIIAGILVVELRRKPSR